MNKSYLAYLETVLKCNKAENLFRAFFNSFSLRNQVIDWIKGKSIDPKDLIGFFIQLTSLNKLTGLTALAELAGLTELLNYSRVRNKRSPTLIIFLTFFHGLRPYSGLHRAYYKYKV